MGTSVNQRSSSKGPWAAQHVVLGNKLVPTERQFSEIWRAAIGDRDAALRHELSAPEVQVGAQILGDSLSAVDASARFELALEKSDPGTLAIEFAKRSLVRAVSQNSGAIGFGADLFAEAISYLVARDLPSYVGANGRIETSAESITFKQAAKEAARATAVEIAGHLPEGSLLTKKGWTSFVSQTARALAGSSTND